MSNNPAITDTGSIDAQVGQAWTLHYKGNNTEAIAAFKAIVAGVPDHIDANFGLALSLKADGQKTEAIEYFQKVKALVMDGLKSGEQNDRLQMLSRMIDQHLSMM